MNKNNYEQKYRSTIINNMPNDNLQILRLNVVSVKCQILQDYK